MRKRYLSVLVLAAGFLSHCLSQDLNYSEIFGSDWQKALTFVEDNDRWIRSTLDKHRIPYPVAVAVVFPELVRYSAIRDRMEISMLKTLYRNLGDEYADFSVGVFQVKPSFAEKIREESLLLKDPRIKTLFRKRTSYKSLRDYRTAIISDLEDPEKEFNYIIAFSRICDKYFPDLTGDEASRIRFLAAAYNTGFWKSREEIEKKACLKFFNTKLFKTENYSYSDVSLFWYNQFMRKENN